MVNDNILRTANVKDLDYIEIFQKEFGTDRNIKFKGSDIADFKLNNNDLTLQILTIQGKKYYFFTDFVIVYRNQEKL